MHCDNGNWAVSILANAQQHMRKLIAKSLEKYRKLPIRRICHVPDNLTASKRDHGICMRLLLQLTTDNWQHDSVAIARARSKFEFEHTHTHNFFLSSGFGEYYNNRNAGIIFKEPEKVGFLQIRYEFADLILLKVFSSSPKTSSRRLLRSCPTSMLCSFATIVFIFLHCSRAHVVAGIRYGLVKRLVSWRQLYPRPWQYNVAFDVRSKWVAAV